jgi:hypothetical protein
MGSTLLPSIYLKKCKRCQINILNRKCEPACSPRSSSLRQIHVFSKITPETHIRFREIQVCPLLFFTFTKSGISRQILLKLLSRDSRVGIADRWMDGLRELNMRPVGVRKRLERGIQSHQWSAFWLLPYLVLIFLHPRPSSCSCSLDDISDQFTGSNLDHSKINNFWYIFVLLEYSKNEKKK